MHDIFRRLTSLPALITPALCAIVALQACDPGNPEADGQADDQADDRGSRIDFEVVATVDSPELTEISGMAALPGPRFLVQNDDGGPDVYALDSSGAVRVRWRLNGAKNRDWEALGWVGLGEGRLLAVGDIGDNFGRRDSIEIYFVDPPEPAQPAGGEAVVLEPRHVLALTYPDGPRDCEAMAYDPASDKILLLTKRDKPPRLYGVDARTALSQAKLQLEFLGTAFFRPPTRKDFRHLGKQGAWISQPTGMDISEDGTRAAVVTYRSLYFFERAPEQSWAEAFQGMPREFLGPPSWGEEAVTFTETGDGVFITTEGRPAPVYYARLPEPANDDATKDW